MQHYKKDANFNGPSRRNVFGFQRFKQEKNEKKDGILPDQIGKIGNPLEREYHR